MAKELVTARFQLKDTEGNTVVDDEGKVVNQEVQVEYDFGDNLDAAVETCGADTVFSNFKANAKVALQGIMRNNLKAGKTAEQIQELVNSWKPGVVMEKTSVDPKQAFMASFAAFPLEKKLEMLRQLGVPEEGLEALAAQG